MDRKHRLLDYESSVRYMVGVIFHGEKEAFARWGGAVALTAPPPRFKGEG